jgi:hypothetical protein
MANLIRLKQIESSSALIAAGAAGGDFSGSILNVLNGNTINNITIGTTNSDRYSLIVSGALAIVNANNLPNGGLNDNDNNVPGQLWLNGQSGSTQNPPIDPSISGSAVSNVIDQGEW